MAYIDFSRFTLYLLKERERWREAPKYLALFYDEIWKYSKLLISSFDLFRNEWSMSPKTISSIWSIQSILHFLHKWYSLHSQKWLPVTLMQETFESFTEQQLLENFMDTVNLTWNKQENQQLFAKSIVQWSNYIDFFGPIDKRY